MLDSQDINAGPRRPRARATHYCKRRSRPPRVPTHILCSYLLSL